MQYTNLQNRRRRQGRSAFTLIELLLVMVIIAILAAVVVPKFTGRTEQAKNAKALQDISNMKVSLGMFETDTGRYPTSEEGLNALVEKPGDLTGWNRPYIDKVPTDPWGHPYVYRAPGANNQDYDLISLGADGQEGTADDVK